MKPKHLIVALAIVFSVANAAFVFAANEPYRAFYSAFGSEDRDPDLDGVEGMEDMCPSSAFDLAVLSKYSTKEKAVFTSDSHYMQLSKVNKTKSSKETLLVLKVSDKEDFSANLKEYKLNAKDRVLIEEIGKQVRVLYAHSQKGFSILWIADAPGTAAGCTVNEVLN